jgi:hypothetical protein
MVSQWIAKGYSAAIVGVGRGAFRTLSATRRAQTMPGGSDNHRKTSGNLAITETFKGSSPLKEDA